MMNFLRRKKIKPIPPRCPECGNRKHNRERKPKIWKCASCFNIFVFDRDEEQRRKKHPKQIGIDIEDEDDEDESY